MTRSQEIPWHAALLGVQLPSVGIIGSETPLAAGFALDDAWVHQSVARRGRGGRTCLPAVAGVKR